MKVKVVVVEHFLMNLVLGFKESQSKQGESEEKLVWYNGRIWVLILAYFFYLSVKWGD